MHAPRRILVPVTLATDSARIVAVAGALAAPLDAELILLGVAPFPQTLRPAAQVETPPGSRPTPSSTSWTS